MHPGMVPILGPPPLPPGWTEHEAPTGHVYYHHTATNQSTYIRPLPAIPVLSAPVDPKNTSGELKEKKKKKEKPAEKVPIPGTEWLKVTTNIGNVFWTHTGRKESVWTVPDEIKDIVEQMEREEQEKFQQQKEAEMAALVESRNPKRKAEEREHESRGKVKKPKTEESPKPEPPKGEAPGPGTVEVQLAEDDDEAWQRQVEEEMTMVEDAQTAPEPAPPRMTKAEAARQIFDVPTKVDISLEEGKALFKTLLQEKDINPLHPWEKSLPLFVGDPRYVLLTNQTGRREVFDEYCREKMREKRKGTNATSAEQTSSTTKDKETLRVAFQELLRTTATSTRLTWDEWRKVHKKDRRFFEYGRDDREREKIFRSWLRELGEKKRKEREVAEKNFLQMLKEGRSGDLHHEVGGLWKDAKKAFVKDPRYDAVGSSSLREELYEAFVKTFEENKVDMNASGGPSHTGDQSMAPEVDLEEEKRRRREKAVKEREGMVKVEKEKVEKANARSRAGLSLEEGELSFKTLLVDAIRDPQATWSSSVSALKADPRFHHSPLPAAHRQALFAAHVNHLRAKQMTVLHTLFEAHAPGLSVHFRDLSRETLQSLVTSFPVQRLGLGVATSRDRTRLMSRRRPKRPRDSLSPPSSSDESSSPAYDYPDLEREFAEWQSDRYSVAREAFDAMLKENAFVKFWGRVGKMGVVEDEEKARLGKVVFGDEQGDTGADEIEDGEGGGGKADLKSLAKGIDVKEMERVLRHDKRYTVFDYLPNERESWLRGYVSNLDAPKASVHLGDI